MLYKFKSKAAADLIMLEPNGRRLLEIVGKASRSDGAPKGILLSSDMRAAISALESAVAQDEARRAASRAESHASEDPAPQESVSLRQRALPFIDMLRRCEQAGQDIVWGV